MMPVKAIVLRSTICKNLILPNLYKRLPVLMQLDFFLVLTVLFPHNIMFFCYFISINTKCKNYDPFKPMFVILVIE